MREAHNRLPVLSGDAFGQMPHGTAAFRREQAFKMGEGSGIHARGWRRVCGGGD
jgi:hypothetical protein